MPRALLALLAAAWPGLALGSALSSALPDAELRGEATYRLVGLPVYHARLYTRAGGALDWSRDFGLELTYLRDLSQQMLVDSTLQEFDRLGAPLPLRDELTTCFRNVGKGDRFTAVSAGPDRLKFWFNDRQTCDLRHPRIKERFMSIFLGPDTRAPAFTRQLKSE